MHVNVNELICGLKDGSISIMDIDTGKVIQDIVAHDSHINYVNAFELRK